MSISVVQLPELHTHTFTRPALTQQVHIQQHRIILAKEMKTTLEDSEADSDVSRRPHGHRNDTLRQ